VPSWSSKKGDKVAVGRGWVRKLMPSGIWHYHYKHDAGKWLTISTGDRDKRGAMQWAERFSAALASGEANGAKKVALVRISVTDASEKWLEYQRAKAKRTTYRTYTSIIKKFKKFCASVSLRLVSEITDESVLAFRAWAVATGNAKVTVDNNLVAIRSFLSWAKASNMIENNPVSQQRHGKQIFFNAKSERRDVYTKIEYARLMEHATEPLSSVIQLLANLGLRISELAMLEWADIDLHGGWIQIRIKRTHDGIDYSPKDNTDRKIPLSPVVRGVLSKISSRPKSDGYVIPLKSGSRTDYAERFFLNELKKLSAPTGIPKKKLILHSFRRFFICECADQGIPMATVIEWVGHDEMKMIMHYYSLRDDTAKSAMANFRAGGPSTTPTIQAPVTEDAKPTNDTAQQQPLGNIWVRENEKPHSQGRERGSTEREGFEPSIQEFTRMTV
jgi:integrase